MLLNKLVFVVLITGQGKKSFLSVISHCLLVDIHRPAGVFDDVPFVDELKQVLAACLVNLIRIGVLLWRQVDLWFVAV